jgi:hypothetical protein
MIGAEGRLQGVFPAREARVAAAVAAEHLGETQQQHEQQPGLYVADAHQRDPEAQSQYTGAVSPHPLRRKQASRRPSAPRGRLAAVRSKHIAGLRRRARKTEPQRSTSLPAVPAAESSSSPGSPEGAGHRLRPWYRRRGFPPRALPAAEGSTANPARRFRTDRGRARRREADTRAPQAAYESDCSPKTRTAMPGRCKLRRRAGARSRERALGHCNGSTPTARNRNAGRSRAGGRDRDRTGKPKSGRSDAASERSDSARLLRP